MKRFFKTVTIYLAALSMLVLATNAVYMSKWEGYAGADRFRNVPENIQVCDFGMSHSDCGFSYGEFSEDFVCFNFAMSSQSPSYDMRILEYYQDHLAEGGIAFLGVSYPSMIGRPETEDKYFLSKNQRYYTFLPCELIKQYDPMVEVYVKYLPSLVAEESLLPTLLKAPQAKENSLQDRTTDRIAALRHGMNSYYSQVATKYDANGCLIINQEEIDAYYEMIRICRENRVTPVLITTPYLSEYTDAVKENDPAFVDAFYGMIEQIQKDTGVDYYDYSNDERFRYDYLLFTDTHHLNKTGAKKFTSIVFEEIVHPLLTAS